MRIYAADIVLHSPLVAVVKNDNTLCRLYMSLPLAPEQTATRKVQQVQHLIGQIAQTGPGNVEGSKHTAAVMGEKIGIRLFI